MIGTQVCVRATTEADAAALRAFLAGLSPGAQYQRFFTGLGSVSPSLVRDLLACTPRQRVLLAVDGPEVIGHAMASTSAAGTVEVGVVVADGHRNRGVATSLVRPLLEAAIAAGADRLRFDVLCENRLVVDWVRRSFPDVEFERDGHTLTGHTRLYPAMIASSAA